MTDNKKPPLGVKPKDMQAAERIYDLAKAIERYALADNLKEAASAIKAWAYEITWHVTLIRDVEDAPGSKNDKKEENLKWDPDFFTYQNLYFYSFCEAESFKNRIKEIIEKEGFVTNHRVAEEYGVQLQTHIKDYGWTGKDLKAIYIVETACDEEGRTRFRVKVPIPLPITFEDKYVTKEYFKPKQEEAFKWHNLTFTSKLNALDVIDRLDQVKCWNMGVVTVEDFCKAHDMFESKIDNKEWPEEYKKWGWFDLDRRTLTVMQYPGRQLWVILMPNPVKLD